MANDIIETHGRKYFRDLRKLIKSDRQRVWQAFTNEIRPRIHQYRRLTNNNLTTNDFRVNDSLEEVQRILDRIREEAGDEIFNETIVTAYVREFVENTDKRSLTSFREQVQGAVEHDPTIQEPWLQGFLETAVRENVKWIKSIKEQYHDKIETTILQGTRRSTSLNDMSSEIADAGDVSLKRARFIARDQTGSLYGDLMKRRYNESGLHRFRWRTSNDERVRDSHEDLDGKVFTWKDGTVVKGRRIWPGTDYGCRCTPEVVKDDLFEE